MKNKFIIAALYVVISVVLGGCYSETVNQFSQFTFQFPVHFSADYSYKPVPRTSQDFGNLYKYKEYEDNKANINKAQLLQITFWLDTLLLENKVPFNPATDTLAFEYVKYTLRFAKPKYGNIYSTDSLDFEPDNSVSDFILGEYKDVKIAEFYRNPKHIIDVPENVALQISDFLKNKPFFYVITEYSKLKGQKNADYVFPIFKAKFDVVIRFEVKI